MNDDSSLFQLDSNQETKTPTIFEGLKVDETIEQIGNPYPNASSEFFTSEAPYLPNTGQTSPPNTTENPNTNTNENQPPNSANISEESNTNVNIGELSDINLNEIIRIEIKNKNYFKSGGKISDFLKDKNKYNNEIFNNCENCNINGNNAFYCKKCKKNLCPKCRDNEERCQHEVINLLEKNEECNTIKDDIYNMIYKLLFKLEQIQNKEKSDKIYNENELNTDINKRIIEESIDNFKEQNDFKLIKRIIKADYINYIHYQNILECNRYLLYLLCFGKHCLIINYNTRNLNIGIEIRLFGDDFVENNRDKFFLVINNKYSELNSKTIIKDNDNYLEVILVKKSEDVIKNLSSMFKACINLKNFEKYDDHDLIDFNEVEDISSMFENCTQETIDLEIFGSFKNVVSMANIFSGCKNLTKITGIEKWDTKNVQTMESMFNRCRAITDIEGIKDFDTHNVIDFSDMFRGCENLTNIPIGKWNMEKAKKLSGMFKECRHLVELPGISGWTIKNVTKMEGMFNGCSALTSLPELSNWDISKIKNVKEMFNGCRVLTNFPDYQRFKNLYGNVKKTGIFDDCPLNINN